MYLYSFFVGIKTLREQVNKNYSFFLALEVYSLGLAAVPLVELMDFSKQTMDVFISTYAPLLSGFVFTLFLVSAIRKQYFMWSIVWMIIFGFMSLSGISLLFVTDDIFYSSYAMFATLIKILQIGINLWWLPPISLPFFFLFGEQKIFKQTDATRYSVYSFSEFLKRYHLLNLIGLSCLAIFWIILSQGLLPFQLYYIGETPLITILSFVKVTMSILGLILSVIGIFSDEGTYGSALLYILELNLLLLIFYVFGIASLANGEVLVLGF